MTLLMTSQNTAPKVTLSALVPVYNEKGTLEEIINRLERVSVVRQIIVVDDCSSDGTREIAQSLMDQKRVVARFHEVNRGKGAALRSAMELATEPFIAIQDADLEYDPTDFVRIVELIRERNATAVYGSRFVNSKTFVPTGMTLSHYLGNRFLTTLFNVMYGQRLTDMETCYKVFRTDLLQRIGIDNDRFDVDPELTAKIVRSGHTIIEAPVSYVGRPILAGKKIRPTDALRHIRTLWRYRNWRMPTK